MGYEVIICFEILTALAVGPCADAAAALQQPVVVGVACAGQFAAAAVAVPEPGVELAVVGLPEFGVELAAEV